jgi:23S rRNA (pseudouridine1915-N3)-methyltransferase
MIFPEFDNNYAKFAENRLFEEGLFPVDANLCFFALYLPSMKIKLLVVGKTEEDYLKEGIAIYESRLKRYLPFENIVLPALKNAKSLPIPEQKKKEGEIILQSIGTSDTVVLLDEEGKHYTSVEYAQMLRQHMNSGIKNLIFVIGGPYGFSDEIYKRANGKLSLSKMTFSHQMVRLFFLEQSYRAMTILSNEPYHHQ